MVGRVAAKDRLARLLAIVPWVASHDGPTVAEVCERFGVDEAELLADLDLLFLCGVHPFTPDTLIEVDVADGRVWIRFADWFRRPLRLTAPEGLALLAAGSALAALPGGDPDGALAAALAKLGAALGVAADDAVDVELADVGAETLAALRDAVAHRRKLRVEYYSYGRDRTSRRVIRPWRLFNAEAQWYLSAWCERAKAERLFRVDRIRSFEVLDATFEPPAGAAGPTALFHPGPGTPTVVLDLAPPAHWVAERYPHEGLEELPGGVWRIRLRVAERAWLERLLLRAGPAAAVIEGGAGLGAAAAAKVLARYQGPGGPGRRDGFSRV